MTIAPIPRYNIRVHPVELWRTWYTNNKTEILEMEADTDHSRIMNVIEHAEKYRVILTGDLRFLDEVERLSQRRYLQSYDYIDKLLHPTTWAPLLTGRERSEFDKQLIKFYEDHKGESEVLRPNPQPLRNASLSLIIMDFDNNVPAADTGIQTQPTQRPAIQSLIEQSATSNLVPDQVPIQTPMDHLTVVNTVPSQSRSAETLQERLQSASSNYPWNVNIILAHSMNQNYTYGA